MRHFGRYITRESLDKSSQKWVVAFHIPAPSIDVSTLMEPNRSIKGQHHTEECAHSDRQHARLMAYRRIAELLKHQGALT